MPHGEFYNYAYIHVYMYEFLLHDKNYLSHMHVSKFS
jgi:hypothetical protein